MDLKSLNERLADLQQGAENLNMTLERTKANLQATLGAIQECQYWINQLTVPTEKKE